MSPEKRKNTRISFQTEVVLETDETRITAAAESKNISLKGMFINTEERLPPGTQCMIEIRLTGSSSKLSIKISGNPHTVRCLTGNAA